VPDYEMIRIEGVLPLGQRWVFWGDALGSTVQFKVGYDEGDLTLPDTPSDAPTGGGPMGSLQAPSWLVGTDADWGQVVSMPMRLSLVGALGLRVQLPWHAREQPTGEHLEGLAWHFATELFPWLHRLRAWLSALVSADLTTESPDDLPGGIPEGVRLRAAGSSEWALEPKRNRSWGYSTAQAISLANWRRAVKLASDEVEVPVEHQLLNAARAALERRHMRLGALEAGTAAEIVLRRALEAKIQSEDGDVSEIEDRTLGALRKIAGQRGVACPDWPEFNKLLRPRNEAAHGLRVPLYPEVREAIRVATEIVNMHAPLPTEAAGVAGQAPEAK
jgi:hypothetical protein